MSKKTQNPKGKQVKLSKVYKSTEVNEEKLKQYLEKNGTKR